ncbi:S4 domain-containing protein [Flavobacteriaceae bacterium]|nr:S4 domain-containing protein [Flavobacteriaceae bacterium]MDA9016101.1 S4 domain-containing protein [Flavobacteriaceae bacterium]
MKPKKIASKVESTKQKGKDKETVRLNKYLSNAGICSRREADENIKMGLVHVNGKVVTEMGFQVGPTDEVKFDGSRIQKIAPVYLLLNKPKGFVATAQGGIIKKSVQELIRSAVKIKIPPIGDMGRPMTGLLFFTNDEGLRKKLSQSPSIPMVYQVILDKNVTSEMIQQLKKGQVVFDKEAKINAISHLDGKSKNEVGIEVHSLSPAALVKLFEAVGLKVIQMDRVTFGGLTKKDLPRGNWRKLNTKEVGFLKMLP